MSAYAFDFSGGHLALDFANTVSQRHTPAPIEHLTTYDDVVAFAQQAGLVSEADVAVLVRSSRGEPAEAASVLRDAQTLRDSLYQIFAAVAAGDKPPRVDLIVLNAQLARLRLTETFAWEWVSQHKGLDGFVGEIVRAAVDLLTHGPRERVSICDADDCLWLFLDTSKNRSRRWCDMSSCGNRAKARRHQEKQRRARSRS